MGTGFIEFIVVRTDAGVQGWENFILLQRDNSELGVSDRQVYRHGS